MSGQLVIYKRADGKVGILYDLGSKSLQMHPKFSIRGEWQRCFLVSTKKTPLMADSNEEDDKLFI